MWKFRIRLAAAWVEIATIGVTAGAADLPSDEAR